MAIRTNDHGTAAPNVLRFQSFATAAQPWKRKVLEGLTTTISPIVATLLAGIKLRTRREAGTELRSLDEQHPPARTNA
eukprot:1389162-Amphidinium_carterae.1